MKRRHPWFIWLSLIGLAWLARKVFWEHSTLMTKWPNETVNWWLGWCGRLVGSVLAGVILPAALAGCLIEPFSMAWNIMISVYVYLAGVLITDYLYNWYNKKSKIL